MDLSWALRAFPGACGTRSSSLIHPVKNNERYIVNYCPGTQHGATYGLEVVSWPSEDTLPQPTSDAHTNDGRNEPTIYISHTGLDPTSSVTSTNSFSAQESIP